MNSKYKLFLCLLLSTSVLLGGCSITKTKEGVTTCTLKNYSDSSDRIMEINGNKTTALEYRVSDIFDLKNKKYEQLSKEEAVEQIITEQEDKFSASEYSRYTNLSHEWDKENDTLNFHITINIDPEEDDYYLSEHDRDYETVTKGFIDRVYAEYKIMNQKSEREEPDCSGEYVNREIIDLERIQKNTRNYTDSLKTSNKKEANISITDAFEAEQYINEVFTNYFNSTQEFVSLNTYHEISSYVGFYYRFFSKTNQQYYSVEYDGRILTSGNNKYRSLYEVNEALIFNPSKKNKMYDTDKAKDYAEKYLMDKKIQFDGVEVKELKDGFYEITVLGTDLVYLLTQYRDLYNAKATEGVELVQSDF